VRKSVMPAVALAVLCGLPSAPPAAAADQAAIVEDLRGPPTEAAPLDYLAPGTVIHLNAQNVIVIDFLRSCTRETIHGGTVRVGALQSEVTDGRVERQRVNCDGGRQQVPATSEPESAAPSFSAPPRPRGQPHEAGVEWTLYGRNPLFDLGGPGRFVLERMDRPGERIELDITAGELLHGRFYDFAKEDRSLKRGGIYRATFARRTIVFLVDPLAKSGATPLAGRLLRF
jgi:hypothetical protein